MPDGALRLFIGVDLREREAGMVVYGDMNELPAISGLLAAACVGLPCPIAGDAVSGPFEAAEFLDIQVDEFAGRGALIASGRLLWLKVLEPGEAGALEHAADGRRRDADRSGDVLAGPA